MNNDHIRKHQQQIAANIYGSYNRIEKSNPTGELTDAKRAEATAEDDKEEAESSNEDMEKGGPGSGRHKSSGNREQDFHDGYNHRNRQLKGYKEKDMKGEEHFEAGKRYAEDHHKNDLSDLPASAYEHYENELYEKSKNVRNK